MRRSSLAQVAVLAILIGSAQAQTYKVLFSFPYPSGPEHPYGGLIAGPGGLYGTTINSSEEYGYGEVYKVNSAGMSTFYYFRGISQEPEAREWGDGDQPHAPVVRDSSGNFYGTTTYGGRIHDFPLCDEFGCGTVFKLDPNGNEMVLYRFAGGADGAFPLAPLIRDSAGNLYGTTSQAGSTSCGNLLGCGTVFRLEPSGKLTVLHTFTGGDDGASPEGGLVADDAGNLFGTTPGGGNGNSGTVFKIDHAGNETILHRFTRDLEDVEGCSPRSTLVRDSHGNLYGTANGCGPYQAGTVFQLMPSGKFNVLHAFTGDDGAEPLGLTLDGAGNLYGVAEDGGNETVSCPSGCGTVFELRRSGGAWTPITLHAFDGYPEDGENPLGTLLLESGGLYGTTNNGGNDDVGVVFQISR